MMRKAILTATVGAAALALGVAGCSSSSSTTPPSSSGSASAGGNAAGGKVGVILPETATSARWENADRPAIQKECQAKGLSCDIQNAQGSDQQEKTIADTMIKTEHVQVLLLASIDPTTGQAVTTEAKAAGVKVIDYDRLVTGSSPDYYVSFDNVAVGKAQGTALSAAVTSMNISKPDVAILDGAPTDNNATLFNQGYMSVIKPLIDAGTWKKSAEQAIANWDNTTAGTTFSAMYGADHNINVVMVANDGMANAVIADLKNLHINGKVAVSGQDATAAGLQHILDGDQSFSIYKPSTQEAVPAVDLAAELVANTTPTETFANVTDPTNQQAVKSLLATPITITKANVDQPIKDNYVSYADVCTAAYVAKCTAAGIAAQ
ncbi:MAG TPA: substrate-binding domain-containing protein [Actinocrinis sp.]|uniref:sugar ABC transporter substrate-binding protein n=1 Tax=Actinocrinis sp. TaxID=1920516 RepID=UPI002DDCB984|nr:substrate-binding domain-containing protein [Actinocrinis sp.]HEV2346830.1 substrate-binding domain-containing protein [Actinocrinis sp.]